MTTSASFHLTFAGHDFELVSDGKGQCTISVFQRRNLLGDYEKTPITAVDLEAFARRLIAFADVIGPEPPKENPNV